jgi:tetratricopeptide (TPR) repeat protein
VSLFEQVTPYMAAAVRVYGPMALSADAGMDSDSAVTLGWRLLREIFGTQAADGQLPAAIEALIIDPEDDGVRDALEREVHKALSRDPRLETVVGQALAGFLDQEIAAGSTDAMVSLGDLLRWQGDSEGAQAAYQRAIDCGDAHAMIDMARLLRGDLGDAEGARAWFQRAIDSGHDEIALEATVDLGQLLMAFQHDAEGARTAFERAISSRHAEWAPAAMVSLARLLQKNGDIAGAQAAYQQAIDSGNDDWAAEASAFLATMLRQKGDE